MAPTSAEIIAAGAYLEDDFDPNTLKVAHLSNILHYHHIPYQTPALKSKLVQIFRDQITARAPQLRLERDEVASSQASDRGIRDGITGRQINGSDDEVGSILIFATDAFTYFSVSAGATGSRPQDDPPSISCSRGRASRR